MWKGKITDIDTCTLTYRHTDIAFIVTDATYDREKLNTFYTKDFREIHPNIITIASVTPFKMSFF